MMSPQDATSISINNCTSRVVFDLDQGHSWKVCAEEIDEQLVRCKTVTGSDVDDDACVFDDDRNDHNHNLGSSRQPWLHNEDNHCQANIIIPYLSTLLNFSMAAADQ